MENLQIRKYDKGIVFKTCSSCRIEKVLTGFHTKKRSKDQHGSICKMCCSEYNKTYAQKNKAKISKKQRIRYFKNREKELQKHKDYYKKNTEKIKQKEKIYAQNNQEKINEKSRRWAKNNPEKRKKSVKEWRRRNPGKVKIIAKRHRDTSLQFKIGHRCRSRLRSALKNKRITKENKTFYLIGCNLYFFKQHIENQFVGGMSWSRFSEIELDHIKPVCGFDLTDEAQLLECFHYTNVRPLWKIDNRKKITEDIKKSIIFLKKNIKTESLPIQPQNLPSAEIP